METNHLHKLGKCETCKREFYAGGMIEEVDEKGESKFYCGERCLKGQDDKDNCVHMVLTREDCEKRMKNDEKP